MSRTMRGLLVLSLLLLAACSPGGGASPLPAAVKPATSPAGTPTPSPAPSAEAHVTLEDARRVLRVYLATDDVVRASGDLSFDLALARDGQAPFASTAFRSTSMRPPRYTWGEPRLLVPRLDRFPLWFAAVVERRGPGGEKRTAVMAFMKQYTTSRWLLSFSSLLEPGAAPPKVALDAEGYATPLPTRDDTVAISPHLMAPLHATIAEEGPGGFAASLIAAGPRTTGYFTQRGEDKPTAKWFGFLDESIFAATAYPIYALRTDDGGAVILYSLTRTTLRQAKMKHAQGLVPVPEDVRWAVGAPVVATMLRLVETHQYVSQVSRTGAAEPARVIGFDGAVTGVSQK
ncbi:hypothetical protein [Sphaerisporangium sp. TRM90804]|uniref:hypothetical protein n=1 Tax=Sphaerisporangium sp. TRM90804 TaxID=3031113 RepID=UPI00244C00A8|nr:hypothetical protein [Sphaerisporangium sp. TRM90804]MDH2427882.1 hypothetical protein [Sphaerisporangium sp. TRM90804]